MSLGAKFNLHIHVRATKNNGGGGGGGVGCRIYTYHEHPDAEKLGLCAQTQTSFTKLLDTPWLTESFVSSSEKVRVMLTLRRVKLLTPEKGKNQ